MSWKAMARVTRRHGQMLPIQAVRPSELTDHERFRHGRRTRSECLAIRSDRELCAETMFHESPEHQARVEEHERRIAGLENRREGRTT